MPKLTLDMTSFKALASDTRLDILRCLDGKKMSLKEISKATSLNKATLHEHLQKLNEAGLVKRKERQGHKWVYYKLTWKGEGLLHPENTRIVIMFSATFVALAAGIIQLLNYMKGKIVATAYNQPSSDSTLIYFTKDGATRSIDTFYTAGENANIASVPMQNQTTIDLSQALVKNFDIKGLFNNPISLENIKWTPYYAKDNILTVKSYADNATVTNTADTGSKMLAVVHDPSLQWIAIGFLAVFSILLVLSIWRYKKNRTQKI